MWWKRFFAQGLVFFIAGGVNTPIAAFLVVLYLSYTTSAYLVRGERLAGYPPPEKIELLTIYISTGLFAQLFFFLGTLTRLLMNGHHGLYFLGDWIN